MRFLRSVPGRLLVASVILAALYFLGNRLSNRETFNQYYFRIVMLCGIAIILSASLNLVNGITGQFSIGHAGFMAIGGYVAAAFTVYGQHRFLPALDNASPWVQQGVLLLATLVGGLAAALFGLIVGLPSLRLRGDYLAIVTLGFGEIVRVTLLNIEAVGGAAGFSGYTSERWGVVSIPALTSFVAVYAVVILLVVLSRCLAASTPGLSFLAVREDEVAAEAMGVNTSRIKVTAFVLSAFFAGTAGSLYAHMDGYLKPDEFGFLRSIEIVTMVVMGGMGSVSGAVVGAIILTAAPEMMRDPLEHLAERHVLPAWISPDLVRQLLYALLLIVLMLTRPQGIFGQRELSLRWLFQRGRARLRAPMTKA